MVQRILDWASALVLIAVGVLALLHEVLHQLGIHIGEPAVITLNIVALLAIAVGLERFIVLRRLEGGARSLHKAIANRLPVEIVDGYDNVYDRPLILIRSTEASSRALVYANNLPLAPQRFVDGIIDHLREKQRAKYHITFVANLSNVPREFWTTLDDRTEKIQNAGIEGRLRTTFINAKKPLGFDVIVIGDTHCCFNMSPAGPPNLAASPYKRQSSIIFENQPEVAKRVRSWLEALEPLLVEEHDARRVWRRLQQRRTG